MFNIYIDIYIYGIMAAMMGRRQDRPTVGGCDYGDSAAGSSTWSKQGK